MQQIRFKPKIEKLRSILCILLLFYAFSVFSENVIIVDSERSERYKMENGLYYLEDSSATIATDMILSGVLDNRFLMAKDGALNLGVTSSVIWLKFSIQNQDVKNNPKWLLYLDYPLFDHVDLYLRDSTGDWMRIKTGDYHPFSMRDIAHRNFVFDIYLPDHEPRIYYMSFATNGAMQITPHILTERAFLNYNSNSEIGYGIFFGALVIMLLYNLFLYISLKDIAYLAYVIFILNSILLQSSFSGHLTQHVLGNYPYWANQSIPIFMAFMSVTTAWFSLTFLNTAKFSPLLHKTLKVIIFLGLMHAGVSFFIPVSKSIPLAGLLIMICLVAAISAGAVSLYKGNKSARFYLLAWSILVLFGLVLSLRLFGILPSNFISKNGVYIATIMEVVLLALALADKYNLFKREKEETQEKMLVMQRDANIILEDTVKIRTHQLAQTNEKLNETLQTVEVEKEKSDNLLLNILPAHTARELKENGKSLPKYYPLVTVLFTDFKNFTTIVEKLSPQEVIRILDECFLAFDEICEKHNVEKIKTIGDSYMAAGGIPVENTTNPVDVVMAAFEMQKWIKQWHPMGETQDVDKKWEIRIGLHSGPLVAGVVGRKKFAYDIWGDTVNVASRMETAGKPGEVNISKSTYDLVKDVFLCEFRGKIQAKNIGEIEMYWVKEEKHS